MLNYEIFDTLNEFTIHEAASYWCDSYPTEKESHKPNAEIINNQNIWVKKLVKAIDEGKLSSNFPQLLKRYIYDDLKLQYLNLTKDGDNVEFRINSEDFSSDIYFDQNYYDELIVFKSAMIDIGDEAIYINSIEDYLEEMEGKFKHQKELWQNSIFLTREELKTYAESFGYSGNRMPMFLLTSEERDAQLQIPDEISKLKRELQQVKEKNQQLEQKLKKEAPYLDKEHEYFAPELEAAISLWNAFFVDKKYNSKTGIIDQSKEWLKKYRNEAIKVNGKESKKALERIATLSNPNKKGGAPKSS